MVLALTKRQLLVILGLEVAGILNALLAFRVWESRLWAATEAGLVFVLTGFIIGLRLYSTGSAYRYLSFWMNGLQLGVFSLPILIVRWMHLGTPFANLNIFGVPGPLFHGLSEVSYCILVVLTLVDIFRVPSLQQG